MDVMEFLNNVKLGNLSINITKVTLDMFLSKSSKLVIEFYSIRKLGNLVGNKYLFEFTGKHSGQNMSVPLFVFKQRLVGVSKDKYSWVMVLYDGVKFLEYHTHCRIFSNMLVKDIVGVLFKEVGVTIRNNINLSDKVVVFQNNISNMDMLYSLSNMYSLYFFYDVDSAVVFISNDKNFCKNVSYLDDDMPLMDREYNYGTCESRVVYRPNLNTKMDRVTCDASNSYSGVYSTCLRQICDYRVASSRARSVLCQRACSHFVRHYLDGKLIFVGQVVHGKLIIGFSLFNYLDKASEQDIYITLADKEYLLNVDCSYLNSSMVLIGEVCGDEGNPVVDKDDLIAVRIPLMNFVGNGEHYIHVRAAVPFAGKSYGIGFVPRGQQEVLLLVFDPFSEPIIVGCLHNLKSPRPHKQGKGLNKTYVITESPGSVTNSGSTYNNSLILDDTKGEEVVTLSSRKNMQLLLEGDLSIVSKGRITLRCNDYSLGAKGNVSTNCNNCRLIAKNEVTTRCQQKVDDIGAMYSLSAETTVVDGKMFEMQVRMFTCLCTRFTVNAKLITTIVAPLFVAQAGASTFIMTPLVCMIFCTPTSIIFGPTFLLMSSFICLLPPALPP